jgi:hypothetical protein
LPDPLDGRHDEADFDFEVVSSTVDHVRINLD